MSSPKRILRLILGDQLNQQHSWYQEKTDQVWYVLMEMRQETDYVRHHIQKVLAFFLAMRAFRDWLNDQGHQVIYYTLDDPGNEQDLTKNLRQLIEAHQIQRFEYQLPDEYRLDQQLSEFCAGLSIASKAFDTEHFLTSRSDLASMFKGKKQYLMENFYRQIRKKYNLLMDGDEPLTGRWNYDEENRKKLPKNQEIVAPIRFDKDVAVLYEMLQEQGVKTIGTVNPRQFIWPSTREESLEMLDFFLENCLVNFGKYQDAMTEESWSVYHSRVSFSLNAKLLSPLEVVQAVIQYWEDHRRDQIHIAQVEGYVRQIIGWREYMRGIYWEKMPRYAELNFFGHTNKLPEWYWTGETKMRCLSHSIRQSLEYAYAHHIQRLMLTGNFALLAGVHPDEVDAWYLGIYIDAIEWVEITNTRGMSQFADGGIVGTKPYVSSANYIDKMGHYCKNCHYNKKDKTGEKACPFNSLYWHFFDRHADKLSNNPRIGMMYHTWKRMGGDQQAAILERAEVLLDHLDAL